MTLNEYKAERELTLTALAGQLGRPVSTVHGWLTGSRKPDWSSLEAIARATEGAVTANDFALGKSGRKLPSSIEKQSAKNLQVADMAMSLASLAVAMGLDPQQIAEAALKHAVGDEKARRWAEENRDAIAAHNAWVEEHGLPLARFRTF